MNTQSRRTPHRARADKTRTRRQLLRRKTSSPPIAGASTGGPDTRVTDEQQVWPAPARALPHRPAQASVIRLSSDARGASELTAYYFHRRRQMPARPSARPTTMFLARRPA
jgi:hypothetical protein